MEKPKSRLEQQPEPPPKQTPPPQTLSPCSSGRLSNDSNSPEFEFWMIGNPSFPQQNLLSADELFVDGVLLPLDLLPTHLSNPSDSLPYHPPNSDPDQPHPPPPPPESSTESSSESTVPSTSKRWRDIFKIGDANKKTQEDKDKDKDKDKEKKKHRKSGSGASGAGTELNINIWPFSRSRSAGTGATRPKLGASRKVSSAPCSRSNSAGESKSRKWPSSPGRAAGIHVGRSSPVWQVRRARGSEPVVVRNGERGGGGRRESSECRESSIKGDVSATAHGGSGGGGGGKTRVLKSLNVPTCIGYRQQLSCRSDEERLLTGGGGGGGDGSGGDGGGGNGNGKLFNLRTLFSKKVY